MEFKIGSKSVCQHCKKDIVLGWPTIQEGRLKCWATVCKETNPRMCPDNGTHGHSPYIKEDLFTKIYERLKD